MKETIKEAFESSLVRHICIGIAAVLAVISGLLCIISFFGAFIDSLWWLIASLVCGVWCGSLSGFAMYLFLEF